MSRRSRSASALPFAWSELDPERRNTVLLVAGIGFVIIFALALIGYGYYTDRIEPNNETILKVGNRSFSYGYVENRAKIEFSRGFLDTENIEQSIVAMVSRIQDEELTRQVAKASGYSATEAEIRDQMKSSIPGQHPSEPTDAELREMVRGYLQTTGYSLSEFRERAETDVLREKMRNDIEAGIPSQLPHSNLLLILTTTEGSAINARQAYQKRLLEEPEAEDAFSLTAATVSEDESKTEGGEKGWVVKGALPAKVEEFAFSKLGFSDIIETDAGYFMVYVRDIQTQEVTTEDKQTIVDTKVAGQKKAILDSEGSESRLTTAHITRIIRALANLNA